MTGRGMSGRGTGGHGRIGRRRAPASLTGRPVLALLPAVLLAAGCTATTDGADRTDVSPPVSSIAVSTGPGVTGSLTSSSTAADISSPIPTATADQASTANPTAGDSPVVPPNPTTTAGPSSTRTPTQSSTRTPTGSPAPRSTVTVTRTVPGSTGSAGPVAPPPPTSEPAGEPGDCPYLSADVVSLITGQHHGTTTLVALTPYPICEFVRSDGGALATVRFVTAATPAAAAAAVDAHVPVAGSQPASQPDGWTGGSQTSGGRTAGADALSTYAVSRGTVAVIVTENESPSIKARALAVCAIHGAGLAPAPAPDYCAAG